jgi:hypothetical protein
MKKGKPTPGLEDRCECGWGLGENLSGDCGHCNAAIAKLPKSNRRSRPPAQPIEEPQFDAVNSDDVDAVLAVVRFEPAAKDAADEDDVFEKDKRVRKHVNKVKASQARSDAEAVKKAKADAEARNLREKRDADACLARSGFTRGFELENGSSQSNLLSYDWMLIHIPRDGHCLMHCFVRILQTRQPGHEIKTQLQMRAALAQFFQDNDNSLEIVDVGTFVCENIECLRTGKDAGGDINYYGGLPECVAFSYRFAISLEVYAPETLADEFFPCNGGGPSDQAPEVMLLSFGWRVECGKVIRSSGTDHWSRMISNNSVPAAYSIAPTQNCIVTDRDGHDHEAKVVHAFQARIPLVGDLVYAYYLETPYGRPLGHFRPSQLRRPEVVVIGDEAPGEAPGATDGNGSVEGEGSGHDSDEDLDDESGGSDDNDGHNADDSIDQGNADSSDDPV